jgi:hypothetical protein
MKKGTGGMTLEGKIYDLGKTCLSATLSIINPYKDAPGNEFRPSTVRRRSVTPRYATQSSNR